MKTKMMGERYYPDGGEENDEQGTTITKTQRGVSVSVTSKRGTGTRDQDTVAVEAHYPTIGEAHHNVESLHEILTDQMDNARAYDPDETVSANDE